MPCAGEAWVGLGFSGRPVKSGGGGGVAATRCGVGVARKARGRGCAAVAGGGDVTVGGAEGGGGRCCGGDDMALTREDREVLDLLFQKNYYSVRTRILKWTRECGCLCGEFPAERQLCGGTPGQRTPIVIFYLRNTVKFCYS